MQTRQLGQSGLEVSAVGLGCMAMTNLYGPVDEAEAVATIRAALDSGQELLGSLCDRACHPNGCNRLQDPAP